MLKEIIQANMTIPPTSVKDGLNLWIALLIVAIILSLVLIKIILKKK